MASNLVKCLECSRKVSSKTGIRCGTCLHPIHPRCSKLSKNEYTQIQNFPNTNTFICNYCKFYKCGKCNKAVHKDDDALECEGDTCGTWFHLKCTKITALQYQEFNKNESSPPWFCTDCLCTPFSSVNDIDLSRILFDNRLEKYTRKLLKSNNFSPKCTICKRKIHSDKIAKALPCFTCGNLIHRKCSGLSNNELHNTDASQMSHWECQHCRHDRFALHDLSDEDLLSMAHNSNFDCTCKKDTIDVMRKNLILNLTKFKHDDEISDGMDPDCNIERAFDMNVDFNYYSVHEFHKLSTKTARGRTQPLSIYHTNIQSLNANFDNLHSSLSDLDYPFDIIALSETWNPKYKKDSFNPGTLPGYKKYSGVEGNTLKGGCGFYIKETLKTINRPDLDASYFDDKNEFQCKWIEVINPRVSNALIAVYYRHPKKDSNDVFNIHLAFSFNLDFC